LLVSEQYVFGEGVLLEGIFLPAHFEVDVAQLVVFVRHGQLCAADHLHDVFEGEFCELDALLVAADGSVVHGEEVVELADGGVVLSQPEGVLHLLHLVYFNCLLYKFLLDAPLDGQQAALGAVVAVRFQQHHVVYADVLELLVLAVWHEVAQIGQEGLFVGLEVVGH
jgi:hypothetical protein